MGASKTNHFTEFEKNIANIGRAMSHPARIRIMDILQKKEWSTSSELIRDLKLSQSSVHSHLQKLKDADMIKVDFLPNCYMVTLNQNGISNLKDWSISYI